MLTHKGPQILCLLGLLCALPASVAAQDSPAPAPSDSSSPKPAGRTGAVGVVPDNGGMQDESPTNQGALAIQELNGGGWLSGVESPLRWRSLYIGSVAFTEGYDDFKGNDPGSLNGVIRSSIFEGSLVFNPVFSRTNIAFQWHPQAGFINGKFADNLSNQDTSLDINTVLSPRLSLRVHDHFSYLPTQNVFAEGFLYAAATPQNQSTQRPFLDGPGTWLTNTITATFTYGLSPTTDLIVAPSFNYSHSTSSTLNINGTDPSATLIGSDEYSTTATLSHRLSALRTVGVYYSFNTVKFENTSGFVSYNSIGGVYSDQLTPTWFLNLSGGGSTAAFSSGAASTWTYSATADIEKRFQRSSASLAYTRGLALSQYASRNFTDRVDLNYNVQLSQRLSASLGFGYQHVDGPPTISGKYGTAQVGYRLFSDLSLLATYMYRSQIGDGLQVFTETRNTAYVTLSWDPMHRRR
jgi:hypothetical protein